MTETLDVRTKGPIANVEMQDHVRAVLQHQPMVAAAVAPAPTVVAWVCDVIPSGTTLEQAHSTWLESYVGQVLTPDGLPRQPFGALAPTALVRVEIDFIQRPSGGMGSHFGFDGYFLSLLVFVDRQGIWDARGELAS